MRNHIKHDLPLVDRLAAFAADIRAKAAKLPEGPERDALLHKARDTDAAADIDRMLEKTPQ